jgi:hypothetical protein
MAPSWTSRPRLSGSSVIRGDGADHHTELGNFEFGLLFHHALADTLDVGVRIGLVPPSEIGAEGGHDTQRQSTLLVRPADFVTASPDATWLRLGVSPTYHSGGWFVRIDVGADLAAIDHEHIDTALGHLNLGLGIGAMPTYRSLGISARLRGESVSPYVVLAVPIYNDDDLSRLGRVFTATIGLTTLL